MAHLLTFCKIQYYVFIEYQCYSILDNWRLYGLSTYFRCCGGIVMDNTQRRRDLMEDNADHELKDLQRLLVG